MNPLKRLWALTGKPWFFFVAMGLILAEIGYCWHRIGQDYDLHQATSSVGYDLGVMASMTVVVLAITLGGAVGLISRRYLGKPLPVDPDFPPTKMVYLQGEGEPERCACHGRAIEDGTEIWHWPQPAKLVCVKKGHGK